MTKDYVLAVLKTTPGHVSGEAVSRSLGISRMAVNTAVKALRDEGYKIDSAPRRGYRLIESPDRLSAGEMMVFLPSSRMENVLVLEKVDSTNGKIRKLADKGAEDGQIVIANEQTAGRGRLGRSFLSLKDKGLYFSILLRPKCQASDLKTITAWTAVAVARAIQKTTGCLPGIKWVNDLVLDSKKICGILTELSLDAETGAASSVIIGIGININQDENDFPEDLRSIAGSLKMSLKKPLPRAALAAALVEEVDRMRQDWPHNAAPYLEMYRDICVSVDKDIFVISGDKKEPAHTLGVGDNFSLRVRYEDGREEDLTSGEISVRSVEGYV